MGYPLKVIEHPLATHKLNLLRHPNPECDSPKAREVMRELGLMLAVEATRELPLLSWSGTDFEGRQIEAPMLAQENVVALPILRSGLVLGEAFAAILPSARTGHIGIHHDYTNDEPAVTYMVTVPNAPDLSDFFIIDSLIGTGETMKIAVDELRALGVESQHVRVMVLSAHEQGLESFYAVKANRSIPIYAFERRSEIDERGLPAFGFGNTADRIYGTGGIS